MFNPHSAHQIPFHVSSTGKTLAMFEKENVVLTVNGESHEVETSPLTLLCHGGTLRIDVPGRFEINPTLTLRHAQTITDARLAILREARFDHLFRMVFTDIDPPASAADIRREGDGVRHVVGMISLLLECVGNGVQPFLRLPESFLHPKAQAGLADLLIDLLVPGETGHETMQKQHSIMKLPEKLRKAGEAIFVATDEPSA